MSDLICNDYFGVMLKLINCVHVTYNDTSRGLKRIAMFSLLYHISTFYEGRVDKPKTYQSIKLYTDSI